VNPERGVNRGKDQETVKIKAKRKNQLTDGFVYPISKGTRGENPRERWRKTKGEGGLLGKKVATTATVPA